jgi:hypothetical protein
VDPGSGVGDWQIDRVVVAPAVSGAAVAYESCS